MSTRCLIGRENSDRTIDYIYCHYDGYIDGVGKDLVENYNNPKKVDELIALGDLSCLGTTPEATGEYTDDTRYCISYKELGEDSTEARTVQNLAEFLNVHLCQQYIYLYRNIENKHRWYIFTDLENVTDGK